MSLWAIVGLVMVGLMLLWRVDAWLYRLKERPTDYQSRGQASQLGNALLRVQALVDPGAASAVEVREAEETEEDASGGPPEV